MTEVVIDQAVATSGGCWLLLALRADDARRIARHNAGLVQALWRFARASLLSEKRAP